MGELADTVAATVDSLGRAHVEALVAAYQGAGRWSAVEAARARSAVPASHQGEVDRLNQAWRSHPDLAGESLALALESVQADRRLADVTRVEVVVTGPGSPAAPVRLTSEVVSQLIGKATQRVTLVSYAAYQVPSIVDALHAAVARGVQVSLILESPEHLEGGGGAHAYAAFRTYHWPAERREPPDAKLHAKAVVVDGRDILLTSANMTQAAYDSNIELGVLCRGGGAAAQMQRHFDALIASGVLQPTL